MKGLFERAVLMGGSALSPWALTPSPAEVKAQVVRSLGCPLDSTSADIGECLRGKSLAELLGVDVRAPCRFCASFAPFVDGAVVQVHLITSHFIHFILLHFIISFD